jgi:hypothetical protein
LLGLAEETSFNADRTDGFGSDSNDSIEASMPNSFSMASRMRLDFNILRIDSTKIVGGFRQLVLLRFQRLLAGLTRLGALAAFQVPTDGGTNTTDDVDNGPLIVTLRIAPTSPIEFITVTLIRAGDGLLDVVVGST